MTCSGSNAQLSPLPDLWRLFVGAPLPEEAAADVWESLTEVRATHPTVRWLPAHKLHLTLVFLGPTDASRVAQLDNDLQRVAALHEPFRVGTGDAGGRVNAMRGGVAWLRIAEGGHRVADLALDLDQAMGSRTYDSHNSPRPHLTLARGATADAIAALRACTGSLELSWTVDRVVLFRSHSDPGGSRYEELAEVDLGPARTGLQ